MSDADEQAKRPRLDSLLQSPRGRKVSSASGWVRRAAGHTVFSGGLLGSLTDRTSVALGSLAHDTDGNGTAAAWLTNPAAEVLSLIRYGIDVAAATAAGVAAGLVEFSAATSRASEQLPTGHPAAEAGEAAAGEPGTDLSRIKEAELVAEFLASSKPDACQVCNLFMHPATRLLTLTCPRRSQPWLRIQLFRRKGKERDHKAAGLETWVPQLPADYKALMHPGGAHDVLCPTCTLFAIQKW